MPEYLTTSEVAALLRIKERKVYDLAAAGDLPCSKAIGKLLFPRDQIEAWLSTNSESATPLANTVPNVALGSLDPLLEWALRESQSGIAMLFDGSADGIRRFRDREGILTGLHIHNAETNSWNIEAVKQHIDKDAVLIEWAKRQRGLIIRPGLAKHITSVADLPGYIVVPRQADAGTEVLLRYLLEQNAVALSDMQFANVARTENDLALAVSSEQADAGLGLASVAAAYKLDFVPLIEERYDLLINRKHFFEAPLQKLFSFSKTRAFESYANTLAGYNVADLGTVHFNDLP